MNSDRLQKALPSGLHLVRQLSDGAFNQLFELDDFRLGTAPPIRRAVQFIEIDSNAEWGDAFKKQLCALTRSSMPHVAKPAEIGRSGDGTLYFMITDRFGARLSSQLTDTGIDPTAAWNILREIATGLSEMHKLKLVHGDVRPENVLLDAATIRPDACARLGDSAVGQLAHWSRGRLLHNECRSYFPPEWNGQLGTPSTEADVYALGLIACEMLLGRQVHTRLDTNSGVELWPQLNARLRKRNIPGTRIEFLAHLLAADPKDRLRDGTAVLAEMNRPESSLQVWRRRAVVIAAIVILAAGTIHWGQTARSLESEVQTAGDELLKALGAVRKIESELQGTQDELEKCKRDSAEKDKQIAEKDMRIDELIKECPGRPPGAPPPDPFESAKRTWSEHFVGHRANELDELLSRQAVDGEVRKQLKEWIDAVKQAWTDIALKEGPATRRENAYYRFRKEPWNPESQKELAQAFWKDHLVSKRVNDQIDSLTRAYGELEGKSWIKEIIGPWVKNATRFRMAVSDRMRSDDLLVKSIQSYLESPWEVERLKAAEQMLKAYAKAVGIWKTFAESREFNDLSWTDFCAKIDKQAEDDGNPDVKRILKNWQAKFERRARWKVQIVRGEMAPGWYRGRVITIYVNDNEVASQPYHEWDKDTEHVYPTGETAVEMEFGWKPGQTILVLLEGERSTILGGARPNLIEHSFDGPVALWRLMRAGAIESEATKGKLTFEVIDCPGPPRDGISSTLRMSVSGIDKEK